MEKTDEIAELRVALEKVAQRVEFKAGEHVFTQGDAYRGGFMVLDGTFKVYTLNREGRENTLHIFNEDQLMATIPFFLKKNDIYHASCLCLKSGSVLVLPEQETLALIHSDVRICFLMARESMRMAFSLKERLDDVNLRNTEERILHYFSTVEPFKGEKIPLPIAKNQLATLLSMTPETLSRGLNSLQAKKIIHSQDGCYIVNPEHSPLG